MNIVKDSIGNSPEVMDYHRLSSQLCKQLEMKFQELDCKHQLDHYFKSGCISLNSSGEDFALSITGASVNETTFAEKACSGIKTWFGMRIRDRGAVLKRLFTYRSESYFKSAEYRSSDHSYIFVSILIMELTPILSLPEWRPLEDYHLHGFSDFSFLIENNFNSIS